MATRKTRRIGKAEKTRQTSAPAGCASIEVCHHIVELGRTCISDLYSLAGEGRLIGVLTPRQHTIYVARGAEKQVKNAFRVRSTGDDVWSVRSGGELVKCRVKALDELDTHRLVEPSNVFAIADRYCTKFAKGTCVNFYNQDGTFAYSWQATEDVYLCSLQPGVCKETVQQVTVLLFPGKNCTGRGVQQTVTWNFCTPA